jgi:hypothetical protein
METITVVIKRNAPNERGMYGYTAPGLAGNATSINSEEELRERLLAFGLSADYTADIIARFKEGHESVTIEVDKSKVQSQCASPKVNAG